MERANGCDRGRWANGGRIVQDFAVTADGIWPRTTVTPRARLSARPGADRPHEAPLFSEMRTQANSGRETRFVGPCCAEMRAGGSVIRVLTPGPARKK